MSFCEFLIRRAAKILRAATAQADVGDVEGAIQRLTDFLAVAEVAANTGPELRGGPPRIKETLHDLQDRGFHKMSRKQMVYKSHGWSYRRTRSGQK